MPAPISLQQLDAEQAEQLYLELKALLGEEFKVLYVGVYATWRTGQPWAVQMPGEA